MMNDRNRGNFVEQMFLLIRPKETGIRLRHLLDEHGYTVKDVQQVCGFESPQAVYKWLSGKSIPSIENLLILSVMLHTNVESILVFDGGVFLLGKLWRNMAAWLVPLLTADYLCDMLKLV